MSFLAGLFLGFIIGICWGAYSWKDSIARERQAISRGIATYNDKGEFVWK